MTDVEKAKEAEAEIQAEAKSSPKSSPSKSTGTMSFLNDYFIFTFIQSITRR